MACDVFVPNWDRIIIIEFEGWGIVAHFLLDCISPQGRPRSPIYLQGFGHCLRELDSILVRAMPIFCVFL